MLQLRIGGVPEHFNLPWHLLLESDSLDQSGITASWQDFPAGTGAMVQALNDDLLDIAILVTEGAVAAHQLPDCQFEMASFYTTSPLLWGIHVPANSNIYTQADLPGHRYAISRYGSGSHLMARVHARSQGWSLDQLQFVLVENLAGARQAFSESRAEIFFWEHFTTKPYVDNGEFRWLGDFPPPWPGFVICVRQQLMTSQPDIIIKLLSLVFNQAQQLKQDRNAAQIIADRYRLTPDDVKAWLNTTDWSSHCDLDPGVLLSVKKALM